MQPRNWQEAEELIEQGYVTYKGYKVTGYRCYVNVGAHFVYFGGKREDGTGVKVTLDQLEIVPTVGMGVTEIVGSDRYPGTIVRVSKTGKTFWYTRDSYTPDKENGYEYFGNQVYVYTSNFGGVERKAIYSVKARSFKQSPHDYFAPVVIGVRRAYQDPSY